jgi:hypothetical protein
MGNNEDAKDMKYLGEYAGYQCWLNSEGFIEGYKSIGLENVTGKYCRLAKNMERLVTKTKTTAEFVEAIKAMEEKSKTDKKEKKYNPKKITNQLKLELL